MFHLLSVAHGRRCVAWQVAKVTTTCFRCCYLRCLTIGVSALSFSTWRRSQGLFAVDPKAALSCKSRHKVFSSQFFYDARIAHVPKLRMPEPQSLRASGHGNGAQDGTACELCRLPHMPPSAGTSSTRPRSCPTQERCNCCKNS